MRNSVTRRLALPLLLSLLAACAQAPTRMLLDPDLGSAHAQVGNNQVIAISASGQPAGKSLGDGQSRFMLERDTATVIAEKLREQLPQYGFQIGGAQDSYRSLKVTVVKADHVITKGIVRDNIDVDVTLHFLAETEQGTIARSFVDQRSQEVAGRATTGEVGGLINKSVGSVLQRALQDPELLPFLGR